MKRYLSSIVRACALVCGVLASTSCDEAAVAAGLQPTVIVVDGVSTGALQLSTYSTVGLANYAARAYVRFVGDFFLLVPDDGAPLSPLVNVAASDGRRWRRQSVPNWTFLTAKFWSVGTVGCSDEAQGWGIDHTASDAVCLATMGELNRRLVGFEGDTPGWYGVVPYQDLFSGPSIHLKSNISVAQFAVLSNLKAKNSNAYPRIFGDMTLVDGGAADRTITAYQPAVPATNTERKITITGLGLVPQYITRAVVKTDGTKFAWVTRQTASDTLAISQPRKPLFGDWLLGEIGTIVDADFTVSEHVSFVDFVTIPDWPFGTEVAFPLLARVTIGNGDVAYFAHGDLGNTSPYLIQVRFGHPTFQTSYRLYGGKADSTGDGIIVQPLFIGTHNMITDVSWMMHSATSINCTASPSWGGATTIQFAEELNITGGRFDLAPRTNFPEQNNTQIATFAPGYPWAIFQGGATSHHGGFSADLYMDDGVLWYGECPLFGGVLALGPNSRSRLDVSGIKLNCPGGPAPGGSPPGGQILLNYAGTTSPTYVTYKNFSDVPFFDAASGISVAGHQ